MKILAFNSNNSAISVALLADANLVEKITHNQQNSQAEKLVLLIEQLLRKHKIWYENLDLIACSKGPDSFTSVRINLACAKMIEMATGIPLIAIDSLFIIANHHKNHEGRLLVAVDAKMDEFFIAEFLVQNGKISQVTESILASLHSLLQIKTSPDLLICGNAKNKVAEILNHQNFSKEDNSTSVEMLGKIAYEKFLAQEKSSSNPLYLRQAQITQRKK